MSNFQKFKEFFDQVKVGEILTRTMMTLYFNKKDLVAMENVRCHMMRAGYIHDYSFEEKVAWKTSGLYFKVKELPVNMNGNRLKKEAYGRSI